MKKTCFDSHCFNLNSQQCLIEKSFTSNKICSVVSGLFIYFYCNGCFLQVYSIRDAAANNLKRLAEEFGPEWAMQHIVPQVCF